MYRATYLVDVLILELAEERVEAVLIGFHADCAEYFLDVAGGGRCVAAEAEEEECCEVLHFGC